MLEDPMGYWPDDGGAVMEALPVDWEAILNDGEEEALLGGIEDVLQTEWVDFCLDPELSERK
jgi:hypothetical protein